jgi:hypothetical protein
MRKLYGLTGSMMMVGLGAALYGIHTSSFSIFVEGLFLLWLGFSITTNMMEAYRLEST